MALKLKRSKSVERLRKVLLRFVYLISAIGLSMSFCFLIVEVVCSAAHLYTGGNALLYFTLACVCAIFSGSILYSLGLNLVFIIGTDAFYATDFKKWSLVAIVIYGIEFALTLLAILFGILGLVDGISAAGITTIVLLTIFLMPSKVLLVLIILILKKLDRSEKLAKGVNGKQQAAALQSTHEKENQAKEEKEKPPSPQQTEIEASNAEEPLSQNEN